MKKPRYEKSLLRGLFQTYTEEPKLGQEFLRVKQTHSNLVLKALDIICAVTECDGIVSNLNASSLTPLCILTADCLPVVLIGDYGHTAIHAGWRGLAQNILLQDEVKNIKPTYAFIGPHISQAHYEVQSDFLAHFTNFPEAFKIRDNKYYFSLSIVCKLQLKANYPDIIIEESGLCTFEDEELHSYRLDKTKHRNWNIFFPS